MKQCEKIVVSRRSQNILCIWYALLAIHGFARIDRDKLLGA